MTCKKCGTEICLEEARDCQGLCYGCFSDYIDALTDACLKGKRLAPTNKEYLGEI